MIPRTPRSFGSAAVLALGVLAGACSRRTSEPIGGTWRIVWVSPSTSGSRFPYLYRGDVKVEEFTSRYRYLGNDCVLFGVRNVDRRGLYAVCGDREPILVSPYMDDEFDGRIGATGLGTDRVPLAGGLSMSTKEAIRQASAQPKFVEGWARKPNLRGSLAAAVQGGVEDVEAVLAAGADPNALDRDGCTALFHAAYFANAPVVARLVEAGVRADVANADGDTALHYLRSAGLETRKGVAGSAAAVVTQLVRHHARVDAQNLRGESPLELAVRRDDVPTVQALLDAGADPGVVDKAGQSPASLASGVGGSQEHARIAELVRQKLAGPTFDAFVQARANSEATERLDYLAGRDVGLAELSRLIDEGADVNRSGFRGVTPLMSAAKNHKTDQVRLLLGRGADPNRRDDQGLTALMYAAHAGDVDGLRLLLERKADVNARTNEGLTAVYWARFMEHPDCVSVLKAAGGE